MPMNPGDIEDMIKAGIPGAKVTICDPPGWRSLCRRSCRGSLPRQEPVQQHQMVYDALKGNMGGVLHALALQTSAPD